MNIFKAQFWFDVFEGFKESFSEKKFFSLVLFPFTFLISFPVLLFLSILDFIGVDFYA